MSRLKSTLCLFRQTTNSELLNPYRALLFSYTTNCDLARKKYKPCQEISFTRNEWYKIMKYKMFRVCLLSCASFLLLASCGSSDDDSSASASTGSAGNELDVSTYVAIGDSLTAGFADNTLYVDGQINSYPNIIANSFALVGGGEFNQPLVNDNLGGLVAGGAPVAIPGGAPDGFLTRLVILDSTGAPGPQPGTNPTPVRTTDIAPGQAGRVNANGPFNNLGVPGARIIELAVPELAANPFYARFASCLLYTSPSPRDATLSRMPSSA